MSKPKSKSTFLGVCLAVTAVARVTSAQTAETVSPDALPGDGVSHLLEVATLGEYTRVTDPDHAAGMRDIVDFAARTRLYLGRTLSYCLGLDGNIGASNVGVSYGVTGYVVGIGDRWGNGNVVSLCGGAGLDGVKNGVPLAARAPAELSLAVNLGPVRPILWARPAWIVDGDARKDGSPSVSFIDELDLGVLLRFGRQHRYWAETNAGAGFTLGFDYRELLGTRAAVVMIGLDLAGAQ